ncbi:DUF397 domain-containing protein [Catellatospora sp. TT07R-123]|uniref:DUF397 domain-containing protein n=1 Tax=Catellatospora sp. TT07R-123 TaxID=2733863 RepID=UPI001B2050B4|nr:DUF397 domain-containing protein [Catellatospora sp. TT07R-123]GHJ49471.1 DUF397 domain-containing protein [Catellatospora sp. TT07R-123]
MSELSHAVWRKSSRSDHQNNCVEVALTAAAVGVRDSKDTTGPVLVFEAETWTAFLAHLKSGRLDRP